MGYSQDRILAQIDIESGANSIVFFQAPSTTVTITIPAGRYWGHYDATLHAAGIYPGLVCELIDQLNASALSGTFAAGAATPTVSTEATSAGFGIICTAAFTIKWGHASTTIPTGLFGQPDNAVVTPGDVAAVLDTGVYTAVMGYQRAMDWKTHTLAADRAAQDKRSFPSSVIFGSDEDPRLAVEANWGLTDKVWTRRYRTGPILSPHIFGSRALDANYADFAGLAQGDDGNGWYENVWLRARSLDGAGTSGDVIIVHNSIGSLSVLDHDYDIARIADRNVRATMMAGINEIQPNGEIYAIDTDFILKTRAYDH